ncbi:hypothetical protein AB0L05_30365 [Nonomuraea pusilla]|uniref:hypothetical protein n=1 Tax=Nonomuraea pusilla TaxID=46177 RepID=UPI003329EC8F
MLKNSTDFRRVAAGTLLIVAPLLQTIAVIVDPGTWGDDREVVSYGDNPALAQLQSALYHWSWVLTAVAAFGLLHLVRRKAVVLGNIAGAMTVIGYISLSALLLGDPVEWWFGRHYPAEEAERLFNEVMDLPGVVFGFTIPWVQLAMIGLPLLIVAVWRAGETHWWVPLVIVVSNVATFFVPYGPVTVLVWTLPTIGLGWIGLRILRMDRAAWASYYPVESPAPSA